MLKKFIHIYHIGKEQSLFDGKPHICQQVQFSISRQYMLRSKILFTKMQIRDVKPNYFFCLFLASNRETRWKVDNKQILLQLIIQNLQMVWQRTFNLCYSISLHEAINLACLTKIHVSAHNFLSINVFSCVNWINIDQFKGNKFFVFCAFINKSYLSQLMRCIGWSTGCLSSLITNIFFKC